jgi:hypothetical protein
MQFEANHHHSSLFCHLDKACQKGTKCKKKSLVKTYADIFVHVYEDIYVKVIILGGTELYVH